MSATAAPLLVTPQKHIDVVGITIDLFDRVHHVLASHGEGGGGEGGAGTSTSAARAVGSVDADDHPGSLMRSPSLPHFHAHMFPRISGDTVTTIATACDLLEGGFRLHGEGHSPPHHGPHHDGAGVYGRGVGVAGRRMGLCFHRIRPHQAPVPPALPHSSPLNPLLQQPLRAPSRSPCQRPLGPWRVAVVVVVPVWRAQP
jgi:hypothetical protein